MAVARSIIKRMSIRVGAVLIRPPTTPSHSHFFHFCNDSLPPFKSHLSSFSSTFLRSFSHHFPVFSPEIGDGGDGGGVALQNVPWGQRTLSIAEEVLMQFSGDIKLFAFKTTPRGYVYVRLDKLTDEYGCPSMEELECYNKKYKERLDEVGALGEIPDDLALEVSTPGAERLLKVPNDIGRFKDMPMRVCYTENLESNCPEREGVFLLDFIEKDSEMCVWKLADVKENRDPLIKGRTLNRKQKDWRLKLPFNLHRMVSLYLA
ncbi:hypothetical protein V8G54_017209 [Vigna mungo]|uniref:DUF7912 domain-containing protein n=1 Tax=Vigna mungo TaxID=3915 RepID=A0AAQ3S201_VIGMU